MIDLSTKKREFRDNEIDKVVGREILFSEIEPNKNLKYVDNKKTCCNCFGHTFTF